MAGTIEPAPTKKWWESKTMWSAIIAVVIAFYNTWLANQTNFGVNLPPIPEYVYGILGALGIYGRATANTTITK